jgi:hypothetical protein
MWTSTPFKCFFKKNIGLDLKNGLSTVVNGPM